MSARHSRGSCLGPGAGVRCTQCRHDASRSENNWPSDSHAKPAAEIDERASNDSRPLTSSRVEQLVNRSNLSGTPGCHQQRMNTKNSLLHAVSPTHAARARQANSRQPRFISPSKDRGARVGLRPSYGPALDWFGDPIVPACQVSDVQRKSPSALEVRSGSFLFVKILSGVRPEDGGWSFAQIPKQRSQTSRTSCPECSSFGHQTPRWQSCGRARTRSRSLPSGRCGTPLAGTPRSWCPR